MRLEGQRKKKPRVAAKVASDGRFNLISRVFSVEIPVPRFYSSDVSTVLTVDYKKMKRVVLVQHVPTAGFQNCSRTDCLQSQRITMQRELEPFV
jgi:hypothetical protein